MSDSNIQAIYPLTPIQEGILFHTLESPDTGTYFNQFTCRIEGKLEGDRFECAWRDAFARHTALRTLFTWEKRDRPLQIVRRRVDLPYRTMDWRDKCHADAEQDLEAFLERERDSSFDLSVAPLSRIALIRLEDDLAQLVWSFHHILLDGWSVRQLIDEVMREYRTTRSDPGIAGPGPSFEDFVSWRKSRDYAPGESFWRKNLAGFTTPTTPDIRLHGEGSDAGQGRPGQQASSTLGTQLSTRLRNLAREQRVTLNTVVVAAWSILLARYCDVRDVVFGTTVAGRTGDMDGIDQVVGLLINTLPLRVRLEPELTVADLLRDVQALQVRQQPFEQMSLQEIRHCSDVAAPAPLFETILVFENVPGGEDHERDAPKVTDKRFIEHSNFPLALLVVPDADLELIAIYDERRYSRQAIEQLLDALDGVLEQLVDKLQQPVKEISAIPPDDTRHLLDAGRGPESDRDHDYESVVQLFERRVCTAPDTIALTTGSDSETYDSLNRRANRLARHLLDRYEAKGRPIVIHARRSLDAIIAMLASLKCGAVYVPTDVNEPGARLRQVTADLARHFKSPATVRPLILTERKFFGDMPSDIADVELISAADSDGDDDNLDSDIHPDDLAYVIYTSGSTGKPKGVMVQHRALLNSNRARFEFYDDQPESFALVSSLATDSSLAGIYWTLCAGGKLVIASPRTELDIVQLSALIQAEAVTHVLCVPSLYALILENADIDLLGSLRVVIVAGEASNDSLVERHAAVMPNSRLFNEYGPSEACVWATATELDLGGVSIGRPIANSTTYVLDSEGRLAPRGVAGELYIGGANLAAGYLGRPEESAAAFVDDPYAGDGSRMYRTGDRVRAWDDGRLEFLGRRDRQIKIRGFRIEPSEIESVLVTHSDIDEAIVYKHSFPSGEQLVAAVAGLVSESAGLRGFCESNLPGHMVPQHFVVMSALPRSPSGKTDIDAIEHATQFDDSPSTHDGITPRNPLEEKLATIWRDVMGIEEIYVFDNFFEIGGDSLMTIRILSRAAREGLKIDPEQFFEHPTIAGQAALADNTDNVTDAGPVAHGPAPLLPIQHWFFKNILTDPHHWNQSYLFEIDRAVPTRAIERVIATLVQRHDALRMQFSRTGTSWSAKVVEVSDLSIESVALGAGSSESHNRRIEAAANQLNSGIDLGQAPLLRACHFVGEPGTPNFLLLVIHHLVVDVESWRILLAELETSLRQKRGARQPEPGQLGSSASRWAGALQALADSPANLEADQAYWAGVLRGGPSGIPLDGERSIGSNRERDTETMAFTIAADRMAGLHESALKALRASLYEVIVSAVARAVAGWTGADNVVFDTEGHGREPLPGGDAATTIGWLTSVFPLVFDADAATWNDATAALRHVKEQIRALPQKGVTFGILRHLTNADDRPPEIAAYDGAHMLLNYLGDVSIQSNEDSILSLSNKNCGLSRGPKCERGYLLEINAYQSLGELVFDVSYSVEIFATETVATFGERLLLAMQEIIDAASNRDKNATVAADFPLADLSAEDIDSIGSQLDALEE